MRAKMRVYVSDFKVSVALPPVGPVGIVADELLPAGSGGRGRRGRCRGSGCDGWSGRWSGSWSGGRSGGRGIGGDRAPVTIDVVRPIATFAGRVEEEARLTVHDVGDTERAVDVGRAGLIVGIRYHVRRSARARIHGSLSRRLCRRCCRCCCRRLSRRLCRRCCRCWSGRWCWGFG